MNANIYFIANVFSHNGFSLLTVNKKHAHYIYQIKDLPQESCSNLKYLKFKK